LKDRSGKEVWTKLDGDTLRKMVNATPGGRYLNVATGAFDLGEVYMNFVSSADQKKLETQTIKRYEERFQIFIGIAILLLCLELIISERRRSASAEQVNGEQ
ncbi:hypothetical protein BVY04_01095, partial [bacterium M21]